MGVHIYFYSETVGLLHTVENIKDFFEEHNGDLSRVVELARKVRESISIVDDFIQQHTSVLCASCRHVCCTNRHAYYEFFDLVYLCGLGVEPHGYEQREDWEPCQFLAAEGCLLDRGIRPARCNWYFCDALYDHMEATPGNAYADFDASLQELADLWMELETAFRTKFKEITGGDALPGALPDLKAGGTAPEMRTLD
jgi:hypothetical protein